MNTSTTSSWSVLCSICCNGRNVTADKTASTDKLVCGGCKSRITNGANFAFTGGGGSWGGKRRAKSNAPSMVTGNAPSIGPSIPGGQSVAINTLYEQAAPTVAPVPAVMTPPVPVAPVPVSTDLDVMISIARKVARETVAGEIGGLDTRIAAIESKPATVGPQVTYIATYTPNAPEGPSPATAIGPVHKDFPELVRLARSAMASGSHLWVYGGAGWGKTHHVGLLAGALGLDFRMQGAIADRFTDLLGFKSPTSGEYQRTTFRDSVEFGGLHLCDEIDASVDPGTPLAINAALSYSFAPFPDGKIARHARFMMVGAANTDGNGATADYVGRIRFDGAFLNRFIRVQWGEDYALETALYPNAAPRVQALRDRAKDRGLKVLITMRESAKVRGMLSEGFTLAESCERAIGSLMTRDQYRSIA